QDARVRKVHITRNERAKVQVAAIAQPEVAALHAEAEQVSREAVRAVQAHRPVSAQPVETRGLDKTVRRFRQRSARPAECGDIGLSCRNPGTRDRHGAVVAEVRGIRAQPSNVKVASVEDGKLAAAAAAVIRNAVFATEEGAATGYRRQTIR